MPDPFTTEVVRQAYLISGADPEKAEGISLPKHADPYSYGLAVSSGIRVELPRSTDPRFLEAVVISEGISERNLRKQVLCAAYRRILRMPDKILAIHFPGTRFQRDQWVRRGLLRLAQAASPELLERLNRYGRKRVEL